jgi:hypothetical protein
VQAAQQPVAARRGRLGEILVDVLLRYGGHLAGPGARHPTGPTDHVTGCNVIRSQVSAGRFGWSEQLAVAMLSPSGLRDDPTGENERRRTPDRHIRPQGRAHNRLL